MKNNTSSRPVRQVGRNTTQSNDVLSQPIDTDKLSAAMTAALRILRPGSNAQVKVTKRGADK